PRVHFAIVCASLSCPDLRLEPYEASRLESQLDEQVAAFLSNPTKGLQPGPDGKTARVSSIFKWFAGDFAGSGGVAAFIRPRDGTIEIARRVPDVTALVSPRGRATQMNAGARAAHGRVLLFLHADTWLPDGALAAVGDALADPAVVGGRFDVRFDSSRPVLSM